MSSLFIVTKNSVRQITTAHMCIVVVANLCTNRLQGAYHQSIVTLLLLSSHQLPIISPAGVDVRNPLQLRLDFWSAWSYAGNCTCHELMHTTIILYPSVRFIPTNLADLTVLLTNITENSLRIGCREVDIVDSRTDEHHSYLCLALWSGNAKIHLSDILKKGLWSSAKILQNKKYEWLENNLYVLPNKKI